MRDEVASDLKASAHDFVRVVWPALVKAGKVRPGRIVPVEISTDDDDFKRDLDTLAGIDAWHMIDEQGVMRGIASRVQEGFNYRTFTIRTSRPNGVLTEFAKRCRALARPEEGWLIPAITVQAYVSKYRTGELLGAAVVHSRALYGYARHHPKKELYAGNGGEGFMAYGYGELRQANIRVGEV